MKRLFRLPAFRARVRGDVDAELNFHLEGRIEELMAAGMTRDDAEREARRRFGDREQVEAEVERIDVRMLERRRLRESVTAAWRDARYALRGLVRRPVYALAVVLTLALGIGANTAIFSIVEAVLLHPIDAPAIGRLAVVRDDYPLMNLRDAGISPLEALDLSARKDLFETSAASSPEGTTIEIAGEPTRATGVKTIGDFFRLFGVRPLYGRLYRPEDSQVGRQPVVVLSYRLWQQLSGDTALIGRTLSINDQPFEVIGVLPPAFAYPRSALYWRPFVLDSMWLDQARSRGTLVTAFVGRMSRGVTLDRLNSDVRALAQQWHSIYLSNYKVGGHTMLARSFVEFQAGQLKPAVIALFVAVTLVLLIACANVASLQLVRSSGRARELAVRAALGAGQAAIARQLIVETVLLAAAGGVGGVLLGKLGLAWLTHLNLTQFPALRDLRLDGMVLAFTASTVVLAGVLFGTVPAFRAARTDVNAALRDSGRSATTGAGRHRFLRGSVVLQNALTLLLLVGAALTIRSLDRLLRTELGFEPDHLVSFSVALPPRRYPDVPRRIAFFRALDERLRAIPGVSSVGFAVGVPFTGGAGSTSYTLTGIPEQPGEPQRHADQAFVYGDFFRTMGIPIVRGHAFTEQDYDASGPASAIVDETLVRQSFGTANPIGVEIEHGVSGTIVGVARSVKLRDLAEPSHPMVYHDYGHTAGSIGGLTTVIRSSLSTAEVLRASRAVLTALDPSLPMSNPGALSDRLADSLGTRRLLTYILAGFAALSFVLALLGVYAVMSYVVSERTREIGIRLALGAQRAEIVAMVLRDGTLLAFLGLMIGVGAFFALGRFMQSLLFGVGVLDPIALGAAVALLGGVTLIACWVPARRAVKVDPVVTLRAE
jgi:putative ABC transport system permease protein